MLNYNDKRYVLSYISLSLPRFKCVPCVSGQKDHPHCWIKIQFDIIGGIWKNYVKICCAVSKA